ncbi:MAG: CapA family protein [Candidatus Colwellbacteria bacterium]|nr:CapA family protein [Candidatus Colwellbacteria bacterium]
MTDIAERGAAKGKIARLIMAVVFFVFAGLGFFMAFGQFIVTGSRLSAEVESSLGGTVSENKEKADKVFLIVVGDIMLDRNVLSLTRKDGNYDYPFRNMDEYLDRADVRIGNLEGPITENKSESLGTNGMRFTFSPEFLNPLAERFDALLIGNNHSFDFGENGLRETKNNLSRKGILFFGDYSNQGDVSAVLKKNGIKIGLVGYHSLSGKGFDNILTDISRLDAICDVVIAMPHWGEEYDLSYNKNQLSAAQKMIDAGADAVIGGHPHVVQPISEYKGKAIFWSLGNFIFDQYFSEETMRAIAVSVEIEKTSDQGTKFKYGITPVKISSLSQPSLLTGEESKRFLEELADRSNDLSELQKESVKEGVFIPSI